MQKKDDDGTRRPVTSSERLLRVLRLVAMRGAVRLSEVSQSLDLPLSTTHRLLSSLEAQGYVVQSTMGKQYVSGPALHALAGYGELDDLRAAALPVLRRLTETFGETSHLIALRGDRADFVDGVECERLMRVGLRFGSTLPAHCTSGGLALLARLTPAVLEMFYPHEELAAPTSRSLRSRTDLRLRLDEVRACRYALNDEESEPGMRAVGVAIVDRHGRSRAALALAAPSNRLSMDSVATIAEEMLPAAEAIGQQLV